MIINLPISLTNQFLVCKTPLTRFPLNAKVINFEHYVLGLPDGKQSQASQFYPNLKETIKDLKTKTKLVDLLMKKNFSYVIVFISKKSFIYKTSIQSRWSDSKTKVEHNTVGVSLNFQNKIINPLTLLQNLSIDNQSTWSHDEIVSNYSELVRNQVMSRISNYLNNKGFDWVFGNLAFVSKDLELIIQPQILQKFGILVDQLILKLEINPAYEQAKRTIQIVSYGKKSLGEVKEVILPFEKDKDNKVE